MNPEREGRHDVIEKSNGILLRAQQRQEFHVDLGVMAGHLFLIPMRVDRTPSHAIGKAPLSPCLPRQFAGQGRSG
jgi:hypothetical protein